jgi:AcrR family transcriptional regulator
MNTRERILEKALSMFNERGIEYVGLRELAGLLDMRVSNITYYFPTKDDLVYEIALLLRDRNSAVMVPNDTLTMRGFLDMMHQVFRNHVEFRCLLLSFVHVMEQNKLVAASYKKTQDTRNATIKDNMDALEKQGYLNVQDDDEKQFLISSIALISRFWISESTISFRKLSSETQMAHYLNLIARLLLPYSTPRGKKEIKAFMQQLEHST